MNERRQDFELLERFTRQGEQSAFADPVRRHVDLVFGTALRKVPLLDEALLSLRERDRTALLLRFYESQSLREVGAAFGITDDTAQKRVQSALEKVTDFFKRRGFKTASVALAAAALEHTTTTASAAVVDAVVSAALKAAPPVLAGFKLLLARVAILTRPQKTALCAALAMCLGLFFVRSCEAANRPSVAIERTGTNVTVRFTGALQRAEQPQGPFRPVPGARSPWVVPAGASQEFWRAWLPGVSSIAAGVGHSVALRADGTLWAWGGNGSGQLGIGTFTTNEPYGTNTPQQVGTNADWRAITAGERQTLAQRGDGTLWAWGRNYYGQLGIGMFSTNSPYSINTPQQVGTDTNWQAYAAGIAP
jgi:hypothetical protein